MTTDEFAGLCRAAGAETRNVPGIGLVVIYGEQRVTNFAERLIHLAQAQERKACEAICRESAKRQREIAENMEEQGADPLLRMEHTARERSHEADADAIWARGDA